MTATIKGSYKKLDASNSVGEVIFRAIGAQRIVDADGNPATNDITIPTQFKVKLVDGAFAKAVVAPNGFVYLVQELIDGIAGVPYLLPEFEDGETVDLKTVGPFSMGGSGPISFAWGDLTGTLEDQADLQAIIVSLTAGQTELEEADTAFNTEQLDIRADLTTLQGTVTTQGTNHANLQIEVDALQDTVAGLGGGSSVVDVDPYAAAMGLIGQSFDPFPSAIGTILPSNMALVWVPANKPITKVLFGCAAPATTPNTGNTVACVYEMDGSRAGVSANTPTLWDATGTRTANLIATIAAQSEGRFVYAGFFTSNSAGVNLSMAASTFTHPVGSSHPRSTYNLGWPATPNAPLTLPGDMSNNSYVLWVGLA